MPIFEQVRDRLPSLYRPSDDDTNGEMIPLRSADILRINGALPPTGSLADANGTVRVTLPAPAVIRDLRIAPRVTNGSLLNLELYRLSNGSPLPLPGAVGRLERGTARTAPRFLESRFAIRLRRPDLLSLIVWATSRVLERTQVEASEVMRSHWFEYADQARYDPFFARSRELEGEGPPALNDPDLLLFPYIYDLSRIGSMLGLLPWREPIAHRERVEDYRQRISRIVALYRNGLGTIEALRRMTEAQLPVDLTAPEGLRDRPFTVEEYARVLVSARAAETRGAPTEMVGPLMRWRLDNDGYFDSSPTVVIQGVTPDPGKIDATVNPVVELFSAGGERARVGIGYEGSLAPDQALRLRPAFRFWVGGDEGLLAAEALPTESLAADPTADGPWEAVAGAPEGTVTALFQTSDRVLWVAVGDEGGPSALHRFDGETWTEAIADLQAVQSLAQDGDDLLIASANGLLRLPLHPAESDPFELASDSDPAGTPLHTLLKAADGTRYAGGETGLSILGAGDSAAPFVLGAAADTEIPVYALHQDSTGSLHIGTELGLFRYQPGMDDWYWYSGEDRSDQNPDWFAFDPTVAGPDNGFPTEDDVFLPPVRAVHRGPDASLWIGTDRGISRYRAFPVRGLAYTTLLEAFPDLGEGRVYAISEDERGLVWFATENGLLRFDGRDWAQVQENALVRIPTLEADDPKQWRFNRSLDRWESFDTRGNRWIGFDGELRVTEESPVRAILWTDGVVADLGSWDGESFAVDEGATPGSLRMRYKPEETRIVDGGIPAIPRIPPGESVWRYLSIEPDPVPEPSGRPAWTIEGRLLPPPEREPVEEGRYSATAPLDLSEFDGAAFSFNPSARVWFSWGARHPLAVLVRLRALSEGERIDPAILDRVWQGIEQVRPAGVRAMLAVEDEIVRGTE